jgi:lipopolysaccharide/colanic/teichoic acid biosynthesis glycosyltransferase
MFLNRPKFYETFQIIMDGLCFWPIWECSTRLRIALDPVTTRQLTVRAAHGWSTPVWLVLILFLVVSARLKLYRIPSPISPWSVVVWSMKNTLAICAATILLTFFSNQFGAGASRLLVVCTVPVTFLFLVASRCLVFGISAKMGRSSSSTRIAFIGDEVDAKQLIQRLEMPHGASIRGIIIPAGSNPGIASTDLPVLGTTTQIAELVNRERLDSVIMITRSLPESERQRCNQVFWRMGVPVSCALDLDSVPGGGGYSGRPSKFMMSNVQGLSMIDINSPRAVRVQDRVTKAIDRVVSLGFLLLAWPLLLLIGLLVKLTSPGPMLERAPRVGLGGRHFTCFKFRTTYQDLNLPAPAAQDFSNAFERLDQVPTPLGRILRRWGLDELPQFWNVLSGDMSLVGPRPLPADNLGPDGMSREFFAWSEIRSRVHPGLTGLWQVEGRQRLSFDKMIQLDLQYVRDRSLLLDLKIILKTPVSILSGIDTR